MKRRDGDFFKHVVFLKLFDNLSRVLNLDDGSHLVIDSEMDVEDMKLVKFQKVDVRNLDLDEVKDLYKGSEKVCNKSHGTRCPSKF